MQYYRKDVVDFSDISKDEETMGMFKKASQSFWVEFEKVKGLLSQDVVFVFKHSHDADIFKVEMINNDHDMDIAIYMMQTMLSEEVTFEGVLMHYNATEYKVDISSEDNISSGMVYKYGEMFLSDDDKLIHNFLLHDIYQEIFIKCERIEWISKKIYL